MITTNYFQFIGNVGFVSDKTTTDNNNTYVKISVCHSNKYNDKQGQQQEQKVWQYFTFWNKQADFVEKYLTKGSKVMVTGNILFELVKIGDKEYSKPLLSNKNIQILSFKKD